MSKLNASEKAMIHDQCLEYESSIWESVERLGDQRVKNYESGAREDINLITPILNAIIEDCEKRREEKMKTDYVINSKPDSISLECPHCGEEIEIPFDEVDFKTDYWGDGGYCNCPECDKEIELGDYEYD